MLARPALAAGRNWPVLSDSSRQSEPFAVCGPRELASPWERAQQRKADSVL